MKIHRQPKKENAQGMVEFALVLPLLLLVMFAVIEFGRLLFIYSAVFTSSREAARYGAAAGNIGGYVAHYQDCAGMRAAARRIGNLVGIANSDIRIWYDDGTPLASTPAAAYAAATRRCLTTGIGPSDVDLGDRINVWVTGTWNSILPLMNLPSSFPISASTSRTILKDINIQGTPSAFTGTVEAYFSPGTASASEDSAGTVTFQACIRSPLGRPYSENILVPFSLDASSTATPGTDFTLNTPSPVMIIAGHWCSDINISVLTDNLDEDNETVVIQMGDPVNANRGTPDVYTLTIVDDDPEPLVTFSTPSQLMDENGGSRTITVELRDPNDPTQTIVSGRNVTVPFSLDVVSSTATLAVDFEINTPSPVTIPAGQIFTNINVSPLQDDLDEDDETFTILMGNPVNADPGAITAHTVTIIDGPEDLPPSVAFTWPTMTVEEDDGNVGIQVRLSAASGREITVPYSYIGSATEFQDYTIVPSPLVIAAGLTTADIGVTVYDEADGIPEPDEAVTVTLGTPTNASLGSPSMHSLVITQVLPPPDIYFSDDYEAVNEDAGTITVDVLLSAAYSQDVSVPITLSGNATPGTDYSISPNPVVIPRGSAGATVQITILNDVSDELDEEAVLTLQQPANAFLGTPSTFRLLIADNDDPPLVYFVTANQSGNEEVGTMPVTVRLSAVSGKDVMVPYNVGGTATQGSDYTLLPPGMVTILAGMTEKTIDIQVVNDDVLGGANIGELSENIILTLGTPIINATAGSTYNQHIATISAWICPTAPLGLFFQSGDSTRLNWNIDYTGTSQLRLTEVRVTWPTHASTYVNGISFGGASIGNASYYPATGGSLTVNAPSPLWSGVFSSRQMVFLFNKAPSLSQGPVSVRATFFHCQPLSASRSN